MKGLIINETKEESTGRQIVVIRHGQTKLNAENKIRAWIDVPLDEVGIQEARDLGEAMFKDELELDGIYTSDLQRSIHTSVIVSQETGIPILGETKAFRPIDVGNLSGKDGAKAHAVIAEYSRTKSSEEIGGGESFDTFRFRFLGGLVGILNRNRGLKLAICTHSRGERLINAWIANDCDPDLEVDLDVFLEEGDGTATAQILTIDCSLILQ